MNSKIKEEWWFDTPLQGTREASEGAFNSGFITLEVIMKISIPRDFAGWKMGTVAGLNYHDIGPGRF